MREELIQRLIEKIKKVDYENCDTAYMAQRAENLIHELQQSGVCVDKFVKILEDRIDKKETYLDILIEGRFATILVKNNFSDIKIEYCAKGPDLKARWNRKTIYFEVTRRHPTENDIKASYPVAKPYGVKPASSKATIDKIQDKLSKLKLGEINILVLWSDTPEWRENDIKATLTDIEQANPNNYRKLSAIPFTNGGFVNCATLEQFYLFENDKASKPLRLRLTKKLGSLHESDPKQLQREIRKLGARVWIQVKGI